MSNKFHESIRAEGMTNAIEVTGLAKKYKNFALENISFSIPRGYISGFIGQNGAGKTTTFKVLTGMTSKAGGKVKILDRPPDDVCIKEELGVLFDQPYFQEEWTPADIERVLRPFYSRWNSAAFYGYLKKFSIEPGLRFKTFSRGMKMKLGLAAALSHDAKLLLLDEPTGGLDPVIREEVLQILREYMTDEERSIFFSTHITSDLEKIADYIVYIHKGKIIFSGAKDELMEKYCVIRGSTGEISPQKRAEIIGMREHIGGFDGLISIANLKNLPPGVIAEAASLDDIMVFVSGEDGKL
ncbi:MAG: ABC transporter ATP-binding protein [Defluviitaleaceae bacterium]|nr:ABC transporter ATP-binding protein [Defluviitaleaceae bacterium]